MKTTATPFKEDIYIPDENKSAVENGRLKGSTGSGDYFFFLCPLCGYDKNIMAPTKIQMNSQTCEYLNKQILTSDGRRCVYYVGDEC